MWLKHNFFKKSSCTLILASCYSGIQSYFKINLDLTNVNYSMFTFYIENHELFGHWQRIAQSWTRIKALCPGFQYLYSTNRQLVPFKKAFMQDVSICTSISWYFNKIDQIEFSELEKIFLQRLCSFPWNDCRGIDK